jgi:hypothetical protein
MGYYADLDDDLGCAEEAERDCREYEAIDRRKNASFNAKVKAEVNRQLKSTVPNWLNPSLKNRFPSCGGTQAMKCHCGDIYEARIADLRRGWALSCSKSCAATRRSYGRPKATKVIN